MFKSVTGWPNLNERATNESGFSALPGGERYSGKGYFDYIGECGSCWSSKEINT